MTETTVFSKNNTISKAFGLIQKNILLFRNVGLIFSMRNQCESIVWIQYK